MRINTLNDNNENELKLTTGIYKNQLRKEHFKI